jgi:hypothetical protein
VRGQQKIFDTARWWDYPLAVVVAGGISLLASLIGNRFGFFTIIVGPIAGMIIAEAVRAAVHKRRSKGLLWAATIATLLGAMLLSMSSFFLLFRTGGLASMLSLLWPTVFAVLAASTVYSRLAGIRL